MDPRPVMADQMQGEVCVERRKNWVKMWGPRVSTLNC